jgi:hypothetical protein
MEKTIVGILIEGGSKGQLNLKVEKFAIKKETGKMFFPEPKGGSRETLRYLSQLRKAELGLIAVTEYADSFRLQTHNVFTDEEEVQRAIDKVLARAEEKIQERLNMVSGWKHNFESVRDYKFEA